MAGGGKMQNKNILVEQLDKVLVIEISRIDKKNALTGLMYEDMTNALNMASNEVQIKAVLIKGQNDLFTSGNDVKDFLNRDPNKEPAAIKFLKTISNFKKPVVAAVGGDAIGIGTTMLMHCDLVIAADNARFQLPFVKLGLCPEAASSFLLPQLAGSRIASELLMLGDFFGADKAIAAGIINSTCPQELLIEKALSLSKKLANQPTDALITTKSLLKKNQASFVEDVMGEELKEFSRLLGTEASKEIFTAFLEKRPVDINKIHAS